MRIVVPKEIMNNENRVALTPGGAQTLVHDGHEVLIETGAGEGASFPDSAYKDAGATIVDSAEETWSQAELLLKVKEPLESEYK
ncbi:MAG: alanine dehydrogenase, partial [Corynebacterium sp.]|nr:alanine dehydrogenase [Corynebacterium sp.]